MVDQVLELHRQRYGDDFAVVVQDEDLVPRVLQLLIERRQKKTAGKLTIAPASSTIAPTRSGPVMVRTAAGRRLMFADGSGAFRIDLGNGEVLHAIRCKLNHKLVREYVAGPEKTIRALYLLLESGRKRARTKLARRGLWRTFEWNDQIAYAKWKIEAETIRFQAHPAYPALLEDARHFFGNIGFFTRHGQNGMRKVLMTGPPGTGKTSILMALATELGRDMPVVLGDDDPSVVGTCAKAAAQARPCIVMVEEMDMLVRPTQRGPRLSRRHGHAAQPGRNLPDRHHELSAPD